MSGPRLVRRSEAILFYSSGAACEEAVGYCRQEPPAARARGSRPARAGDGFELTPEQTGQAP